MYITEACQPYEFRDPAIEPPAHITGILDRLDDHEIRQLAVILSVADPVAFEAQLRTIWAARQP